MAERINALLPQTQCSKCGHPGCRPYADAVAAGEAINRCPPGGDATIAALAHLLERPILPLDSSRGEHLPPARAFIREPECIGCTKCIQVCPTDAILGGPKLMHTVIESECTGCDLCVAACPVDCIDMLPLDAEQQASIRPAYWQQRFENRQLRLEDEAQRLRLRRAERRQARDASQEPLPRTRSQLQQEIQEAVARVQARKAERQGSGSQGARSQGPGSRGSENQGPER